MVDLTTDWVGLRLPSPLFVGASPLSDDLEALQVCVRGGAGAVVMRSLFEEQITAEQLGAHRHTYTEVVHFVVSWTLRIQASVG